MKSRYSLVVVGGGPAGMAAAQSAAKHGVEVALLDEQDRPGGQIYRNVDHSPLPDPGLLGPDYLYGREVTATFKNAGVDYIAGAAVWGIDQQHELGVLLDNVNHGIGASHIIIAAGAQERAMPFPGWQLPGVMTAGAGQIMLKSAAMVPSDGVVLAGSGPLLLLLAWQYLCAGVKVQALLDTTPRGNLASAVRYLPGALRAASYLAKGLGLVKAIKRARLPVYKYVTSLAAEGDGALRQVCFNSRGQSHTLNTDTLLLHQGVIPQLHLPLAADCEVEWDELQLSWRPTLNEWGLSAPRISIAGDGGGIVGARASELHGQLVGLHGAFELGALSLDQRDQYAAPIRKSLQYHLAIRPFLDALYRPAPEFLAPGDATLVCRCEEVTAGEIRRIARLGCPGPNQAKAFSRCGMGPCQGRLCGNTVSALIAEVRGVGMAEVGHYRVRPPVKPLTLGQMARFEP